MTTENSTIVQLYFQASKKAIAEQSDIDPHIASGSFAQGATAKRSSYLGGIWFAVFAISLIGGCAFVETSTIESNQGAVGVSYYLPLRPVKLVFVRTVRIMEAKELEKALTKARIAHLGAKTKVEADDAALKAAKARLVASLGPAERVKAQALIETVDADLVQSSAALIETVADLDALFKEYKESKGAISPYCIVNETLSAEPMPMVADLSQRFSARLKHNPFRSDTLTLTTTKSGLLDNIAGNAQDQTAAIIVSLAQANATRGFSPPILFSNISDRPAIKMPKPAVSACEAKTLRIEQVLNPYGNTLALNAFAKRAGLSGLTLEELSKPKTDASKCAGNESALYYRREQAYTLNALSLDGSVLASIRLDLPQGAPCDALPLKSGFANTVALNTDFDDGMLVSHTDNRPSEALAIAKIPFDAAKAAMEVPATLLQFKITQVTRSNELSTALAAQGRLDLVADAARLQAELAQLCAQERLAAASEARAVRPNICPSP